MECDWITLKHFAFTLESRGEPAQRPGGRASATGPGHYGFKSWWSHTKGFKHGIASLLSTRSPQGWDGSNADDKISLHAQHVMTIKAFFLFSFAFTIFTFSLLQPCATYFATIWRKYNSCRLVFFSQSQLMEVHLIQIPLSSFLKINLKFLLQLDWNIVNVW